jgi:hypothetical protein
VPLPYPAAAAALEYAATLSAARAVATAAAAATGTVAFSATATNGGTVAGISSDSGSTGALWPEHLAAPAHAAELPLDEARCISEGLRCTEGQVRALLLLCVVILLLLLLLLL